jgi:hypothetical protein
MASPTRGLCPLDPHRRAADVVRAARRESPACALHDVPLMSVPEQIKWGLGTSPQRVQGSALAFPYA